MVVEHWDSEQDGPLREQTLRAKLEACGYQVTRYVYPPGTVFPATPPWCRQDRRRAEWPVSNAHAG